MSDFTVFRTKNDEIYMRLSEQVDFQELTKRFLMGEQDVNKLEGDIKQAREKLANMKKNQEILLNFLKEQKDDIDDLPLQLKNQLLEFLGGHQH